MIYKYIKNSAFILFALLTSCSKTPNKNIDEIKNLIETNYIQGALNKMNTSAMIKGYHKDFAIFYSDKNDLRKLPLNNWVKMVEDYKSDGESMKSGLREMSYDFKQIDVTGKAASVKLNLYRKDQLIFTDYITLLKFDEGWKIVTKIYHAHIENPWGIEN